MNDRFTYDGHAMDDEDAPCPKCGFQRLPLPAWVRPGAAFALDGQTYRILTIGSSNHNAPQQAHFYNQVTAEPLSDSWALPKALTREALVTALQKLCGLPTFDVNDLERALHVEKV